MNLTYEKLLELAEKKGLIVMEEDLEAHDGLIYDNIILIDKKLKTDNEKACVLAEEIGHYNTTVGNILDLNNDSSMRQELKARAWAYDRKIGLLGIVTVFNKKCLTMYEVADFLGVTEEFLLDALQYYKNKYGLFVKIDSYIIYFEPVLGVMKML